MDVQRIKQLILSVLKTDDRLWNDDKTELNQTLLLDLVSGIDEGVIGLLLHDDVLREKFFVKIHDSYVFKSNDFMFFMEENKVNNSYTQYKNRIGLTDGKRFLKDSSDVVLDFPYKDCVLEGGQSTEEGIDTYFEYEEEKKRTKKGEKIVEPAGYKEKQAKRKETFFNQVLAHDEIDRLFDEKALVNWKRYTKDGEQDVTDIARGENGTIKENLVIKGNNLLALHSLKKQFAGKIKLIYIDPPYNTGKDGFKYNDNFNHSTWLTFMKNRLEIARELLSDDGGILVQCDDNEQAYLKVLMDEVFGRRNFITNFVWKGRGGRQASSFIAQVHETIVFFAKDVNSLKVYKNIVDDDSSYPFYDEQYKKNYKLQLLRKWGNESRRQDRENMYYPVLFEGKEVYPILPDGEDGRWRWKKENVEEAIKNNLIEAKEKDGVTELYEKKFEGDGKKEVIFNSWIDEPFSGNAADHHKELFGSKIFDYPKPEGLLKIILDITTQPNDIVLDYHVGSGTTASVAHKMGRPYIAVEQMDYIRPIAVERLIKVVDGESGGISEEVGWEGGGDFIYCELAKWNEQAKENILACDSLTKLEKLFDTLYEKYFLNYNFKIKEFREKVIKEEMFLALSLDEQKAMFISMLDLNQLYIQKSEMPDKKYKITKEDQKVTNSFYDSES